MTRLKFSLVALFAVLSGFWLYADPIFTSELAFQPVRNALINYTGILGIAAMSAAMLLAVRPVVAERYFDGLDKMYRLHKWLGIAGLSMAVTHWLLVNAPKWATQWGLMERRPRGPRIEPTDPVEAFLHGLRGIAEGLGEWTFYIAAAIMVVALVKLVPYRWFQRTHVWLPVAYLVLVFHAVVLMKFSYWSTPLGPVMALILTAGSIAALISLFSRIGRARRTTGVVEDVTHHSENRVLQVTVKLAGRWLGHNAGQFAFVTFDQKEGAHPFTIVSAWKGDGRITFLIKGLGDYTQRLPQTLHAGMPVTVEGPYGRFDFSTKEPRQVWVAGGIGITPFIARIDELAKHPDGKAIDLFYATAAPDQSFVPALRQRAEAAGVNLSVINSPRDGFLTAAAIIQKVPQWKDATFWFCGPSQFGETLKRDLLAGGLAGSAFHQEYFEFR